MGNLIDQSCIRSRFLLLFSYYVDGLKGLYVLAEAFFLNCALSSLLQSVPFNSQASVILVDS